MVHRLAYKIFFIAIGVLAAGSVVFVYARFWTRGETAPIPPMTAAGMLFISVVNILFPMNDRRQLVIKGILAALTLCAVYYVIKLRPY